MSRTEEGKGLTSIEDSINASIQGFRWHYKLQKKTDYSHQKRYRQYKHQQNYYNQKTKLWRKTTVWIFQVTNKQNLAQENMDMAKKRKPLERNWITSDSSTERHRKDYVKTKIDRIQQNSQCTLSGDRDEMINHLIKECSKLAQKDYKTRHN